MNQEAPQESGVELEASDSVKKEKKDGKAETGKAGRPLQQKEDQAAGSISWKVWKAYGKASNGLVTIPCMFLALFLMGASQGKHPPSRLETSCVVLRLSAISFSSIQFRARLVATRYLWSRPICSDRPLRWTRYFNGRVHILRRACCRFLASIRGHFVSSPAQSDVDMCRGTTASRNLHNSALKRLVAAPMSFFDTTPLGRHQSRMGKDVDAIDNRLNDSLRMVR